MRSRDARAATWVVVVMCLAGCPRDRQAAPEEEADDRLAVGRVTTELHVFAADGEPLKTSLSLDDMVRGELAKSKSLRSGDGQTKEGGKAARLRVRGVVSPDGASGELHAIVSARLDRTGSIPLQADIDAIRPGGPDGGQLDTKIYEAHLSKALHDALGSLDAQVGLLQGGPGPLIEALRRDEPSIRISAARELGERHSREAVEPMCELLRQEQGVVGEALIGALAAIGDERGVPCIIHWAGTDERRTLISLEPIAEIGGSEAQAYIEMVASGHEHPGVRRVAEHALERIRTKRSPSKAPSDG